MATRIVKSLMIHWFAPVPDPMRPGETVIAEVKGYHGQRVSTDESGDDPNTKYGMPEETLERYDREGHFFTQAEIDAMNSGVTDTTLPVEGFLGEPRGDTVTSPMVPGVGNDPGAIPGSAVPHPLTFQEMDSWQVAEWLRRENPEEDVITNLIQRDRSLAPKFVDAIGQVWSAPDEQDDRDYLIAGIAAIVGSGVAPTGSEGVEGTAPPDNPEPLTDAEGTPEEALAPVEAPEDSDDQEYPGQAPAEAEPPPEPEEEPEEEEAAPNATDSAKAYAAEKGIDLAEVTGTGSGGAITKADVQAHESR